MLGESVLSIYTCYVLLKNILLLKGCEAMDCIKATASAALYPWRQFWRLHQIYLDKTVLHVRRRWLVTAALASMYKMCLLMSFTIPFVDGGIPLLPIKGSDEFQPFIGRRSEFQLW